MIYIENKKMLLKKIKVIDDMILISKINIKSAKRVYKILKKNNIKRIVCNKEIMKNNDFINYMYKNKIYVHNGRYLYKSIIKNILDYLKNLDIKLERMSVAILLNDNNIFNLEILYLISNTFKSITIVTKKSKLFFKIEKELEENGIVINIANNKKKTLKNIDIIFNMDFSEEIINQYRINNNAIIFNIAENIRIHSKQFNGININYYQIDFGERYSKKYNGFDENLIYESEFVENRAYCSVAELKIANLIGCNGIISKEEYKKILTNKK